MLQSFQILAQGMALHTTCNRQESAFALSPANLGDFCGTVKQMQHRTLEPAEELAIVRYCDSLRENGIPILRYDLRLKILVCMVLNVVLLFMFRCTDFEIGFIQG